MQVGFIGLGHMGFPMAQRLLGARHEVIAFDTRREALDKLVALGALAATSPKAVADRVDTVLASLPSLQASLEVATGSDGVIQGSRVRRFIDLSTVGSQMAQQIDARLASRNIALVDAPVSGGVGGAEKGTLAVMVSGPAAHVEAVMPFLCCLGRPFRLGERIGAAQTMKLINNLLSATALAATGEALVMGVKAGLDAEAMLEVINAGSGANTASRDKFPRAVIPRTFDYGFATGLMVKDLRLCLEEVRALGLSLAITETAQRVWESTMAQFGPESDFTSVVRPIENAAGITIGGSQDEPT
jgi:3-hydroxyisobutyrate dehydrogenase-like beta-hydroxyacid dehydrogenase